MGHPVKPITKPFKPHIATEALEFFETLVNRGSVVFEWGSGSSTLWLAERAAEVISVEHDAGWYEEVASKLAQNGLGGRVELALIPEERDYINHILFFEDNYFDVIFIDGLDYTRRECVSLARSRIIPGGWLALDDTNWAMLRPAVQLMRGWEYFKLSGEKMGRDGRRMVESETTFFRKPRPGKD